MSTTKIDTRFFNQACRSIAKAANIPPEKVIRHEVGKVMESALKNTRAAKASLVRGRYEEFVPLSIDSYSPKRIRRYGNLRGNYLAYYMQNRYPNELWSRLRARRKMLIMRTLAARGLAKRSWLDLAEKLGETIAAPGYVAQSVARTGKLYAENTSVSTTKGKGRITIKTANSQPTVNAIGGSRAFQRAIEGRAKFFIKNVELGVFDDVAKTARQYPGMKAAA